MQITTIKDEYTKNKNIRPEDVKLLLEWAEKQMHLPQITELEAIIFLSACNGSIETGKNLIDFYFTSRTHCPEFFENRYPTTLANDMEVVLYYPLSSDDKNYQSAFYTRFMDANPDHFNLNEQLKIMWMVQDLWLLQNGSIDGYQFIIDMQGVQLGHLTKLSVASLKKALYILQEAIPLKITQIHVVNVLSLADKILSIMKPFIKVDLLQKIIFHTDGLNSLLGYISKSNLPKNLDGNGLTLNEMHDNMKKMLNENSEYFQKEELTKRVDETKRQGKAKTSSDLFGIEGSFKKLDID